MTRGTLLAILILGGYLGVEAYTFSKVSYRMEPAFIHQMLVQADTAAELCGKRERQPVMAARFEKTLQRETNKLLSQLQEEQNHQGVSEIKDKITVTTLAAKNNTATLVDELGCDHQQIVAHLRKFDIYAKRSRL